MRRKRKQKLSLPKNKEPANHLFAIITIVNIHILKKNEVIFLLGAVIKCKCTSLIGAENKCFAIDSI